MQLRWQYVPWGITLGILWGWEHDSEKTSENFTPFKKQITLFQAKIMCGLGFVFGDIVNTPMYFITGDRLVVVETSNVSRCSIKNEFDRDQRSDIVVFKGHTM